jgi:DUF1680 family protein
LRIPGWCAAPRASVNGTPIDLTTNVENGYLRIERAWQSGDHVDLDLPMPVERLYAHPAVAADVGQVALRRGPLIYCLEQVDHDVPISRIALPESAELAAQFEPELLGGVVTVAGSALALGDAGWEGTLYRTTPPSKQPSAIKAIPYYAWDHRAPGAMRVWIESVKE